MEPSSTYLWRLTGEAFALCYRAARGYEIHLTTEASLILSGEPVADLNYAILDAGPKVAERLREFCQVIRVRKLPIIALITDQASEQLTPIAIDLGFRYAVQIPLMTYRPRAVNEDTGPFQVGRVEDLQDLKEMNYIIASGFSMPGESVVRTFGPEFLDGPGVDAFLAWRDGIAVSTVQTTRTGPTVGIWAMATPPEHQRQGAGRVLLNHVIAYHSARGAKFFYLGATAAGKPLYERIGFQTVAEAQAWVLGESTQASTH